MSSWLPVMLDLCLTRLGTAIVTGARAFCLLFLALGARIDADQSFIINPLKQEIHLPGTVFAVTTTRNGKYVFVSTSGQPSSIAILKQRQSFASPVRFLAIEGDPFGLVLTRDGRYLLVAVRPKGARTSPAGVLFIDVRKAIAGKPGAVLGTVPNSESAIEVGLSKDGRFVFVANESQDTVSVIDFEKALASGQSASSIVGTIPVDIAPVGLAFSGDGRYLYVTNETAKPGHPGYDPTACKIFDGVGTPPKSHPGPKGILSVIDVRKAKTTPHDSVLASVFAGCSPTRVILSGDSKVAWVSARDDNRLLAFNTRDLLANPSDAILSTTPVGVAPDGVQPFANHRFMAVANTNRFETGQAGTVTVLSYRKALRGAGDSAVLGTFSAGEFPRQWALAPNGKKLYLTEYSSDVLAIFPVPELRKQLP